MARAYEHLHIDLSPRACELVESALSFWLEAIYEPATDCDPALAQEVRNLANECRSRVQHAAAGIPDISEDRAVTAARHSDGERGDGPDGAVNPSSSAPLSEEGSWLD